MVLKGNKIIHYSEKDYKRAIELKEKGYGSLRISKILGFNSRSVVEEWINRGRQPYYVSKKRINWSNSKKNIERIKRLNKLTQPNAVKISAILRTKKLLESAKIMSPELAYILGVVYGDGHVSIKQRRIILSVIDKDFALNFKENLEKWSGFKVRFFTRKIKTDKIIKNRKLQYACYVDSINASKFIKSFDLNLLKKCEENFKVNFIKGFFDSEGCVCKKGVSVMIYNSDYVLIKFVEELLNSLNIKNSIRSRSYLNKLTNRPITMYVLSILGVGRKIFAEKINSSIKRKKDRLARFININQ